MTLIFYRISLNFKIHFEYGNKGRRGWDGGWGGGEGGGMGG